MPRDQISALFVCTGLWVALVVGPGCATIPAPVISPADRPMFGPDLTWAGAWGQARARVRQPDGSTAIIHGNGDAMFGQTGPSVVGAIPPAAFSVHEAAGEWDWTEYVNWRRFGLAMRRRLQVAPDGAMTSLVATGNAEWKVHAYDGSLALEQTLPLGETIGAIFRLGGSYGLRDYDIDLPHELETTLADGLLGETGHWNLLRADVRLESLFGLLLGSDKLVLSFQPYLTIAHGDIRNAHCSACKAGVELLDYTQSWGFALALSVHTR